MFSTPVLYLWEIFKKNFKQKNIPFPLIEHLNDHLYTLPCRQTASSLQTTFGVTLVWNSVFISLHQLSV